MEKCYNIALLPVSKQRVFTDFAKNFHPVAGKYRLGEGSLPHITLCQFITDEDKIAGIWKKVTSVISQEFIPITLVNFSSIKIDDTKWLFLRPDNLELLMQMHCAVATIIESRIGKCFEKYDAHMTLVNSGLELSDSLLGTTYLPVQDKFFIALGDTDDVGQFTKIVYQ